METSNFIDKIKNYFSILAKYKEIILLLAGLVLFFILISVYESRNQSLLEENQIFFQQTTEDLTEIRENYEREKVRLEEINRQRQEEIQRLTSEYEERITTLEQRTRSRRADFVRETDGNPQEMADRLTKRLRWERQQ